jgi:hypothetical protein
LITAVPGRPAAVAVLPRTGLVVTSENQVFVKVFLVFYEKLKNAYSGPRDYIYKILYYSH